MRIVRWDYASLVMLGAVNLPFLAIAALGAFSIATKGISAYSDDRVTQLGIIAYFAGALGNSAAATLALKRKRIEITRSLLLKQFMVSLIAFAVLLWWVSLR